jgi:hypothetical protein
MGSEKPRRTKTGSRRTTRLPARRAEKAITHDTASCPPVQDEVVELLGIDRENGFSI